MDTCFGTLFDRKPVNDDLMFVYMEKTCDYYKAELVMETERLFLREMNMGDYEALYNNSARKPHPTSVG